MEGSSSTEAAKRQRLIQYINVQDLRFKDLKQRYDDLLAANNVQSENIGGLMGKLDALIKEIRKYATWLLTEKRKGEVESLTPQEEQLILALRAALGRDKKP